MADEVIRKKLMVGALLVTSMICGKDVSNCKRMVKHHKVLTFQDASVVSFRVFDDYILNVDR